MGKNAGLYQIIPHKPYKRGLMYGVENQTTAATGNYTGNTCQRRNTERIRPFDTPLNKTNGKGSGFILVINSLSLSSFACLSVSGSLLPFV
jgi:hypothetical protein